MVNATNKKGFNRVSWNLSYASRTGIGLNSRRPNEMEAFMGSPFSATPGEYTAELMLLEDGKMTSLAAPVAITVKRLKEGALPAKSTDEINEFREDYQQFRQDLMVANTTLSKAKKKLEPMPPLLRRQQNRQQVFLQILIRLKEN